MKSTAGFLKSLSRPTITSRRELISYVVATTLVCVALALAFDVVNQLTFFDTWPATLRSWAVTAVVALVIAAPISWMIGRAHLELNAAKLAAEILSRTDPLTGLPNRRAVFEHAARMRGHAMILVVVDLDRFKRVNDTHGHLAGDHVIVGFSRMMSATLGPLGAIGRIGGEEFMLVAPLHEVDSLATSLAALRDRAATTRQVFHGREITVTISAGVAASGPDGDFDALYREADRALYEAKELGRNCIVYSPSFERLRARPASSDELIWAEDLSADLAGRNRRGDFGSVA